jgi:copper chaperone CopZ
MPTPPAAAAPKPTPAPTPSKPAPEPIPNFSGQVVLTVYSDAIVTGEGSKNSPGLQLDWDKVESSLKRVAGVASASLDAASRRINVSFVGPFKDIEKVRNAVQTSGVSAELLSPAKVIFRPTVQVESDSKLVAALKGAPGVQMVLKDLNDYTLYADLSTLDLDEVTKAALSAGVKGMTPTHELIKTVLPPKGGDAAALIDELNKTKWVVKADIEAASNTLRVVAIKGRVTRALIKSLSTKCGFAESK